MKMKITTLFMLAGISVAAASHAAQARTDNPMGIQFSVTGDNIVSAIESLGPGQFPGLDIAKLRNSVNTVSVDMSEYPLHGDQGQDSDAVNDPKAKKIWVYENAWLRLYNNPQGKLYLVLHEYLGVSNLEPSDSYARTGLILTRLKKAGVNLVGLVPTQIPLPFDFSGAWKCAISGSASPSLDITASKLIQKGREVFRISFTHDRYAVLFDTHSVVDVYSADLDLNQPQQVTNVLKFDVANQHSSGGYFKLDLYSGYEIHVEFDTVNAGTGRWNQTPASFTCHR
jgi:hypothetical protein